MQEPPNPYLQFKQQQWQQPSQPLEQQRQQQPDYTQPKTYNSPQNMPSPPPSTSKTLDRTLWILIGLAIGLVFGLIFGAVYEKQQITTTTTTIHDTTQATSQSQPTQVAPTPIPTIAPIALSGVGQQASHKFQLHQGLAIFKLTHNGSANFIVHLLDSNGQMIDDLVNEIGSFDGSKAEGIQNAGAYILDIQADGKWMITIQQPRPTTAPSTTNFHGKGQAATQLFSMQTGLKTIKMAHDGTSNFIIHILDSNGNVVDDIVNEIGKFNGSKAEGIQNDGVYLFDVQADGNWTISIQ